MMDICNAPLLICSGAFRRSDFYIDESILL